MQNRKIWKTFRQSLGWVIAGVTTFMVMAIISCDFALAARKPLSTELDDLAKLTMERYEKTHVSDKTHANRKTHVRASGATSAKERKLSRAKLNRKIRLQKLASAVPLQPRVTGEKLLLSSFAQSNLEAAKTSATPKRRLARSKRNLKVPRSGVQTSTEWMYDAAAATDQDCGKARLQAQENLKELYVEQCDILKEKRGCIGCTTIEFVRTTKEQTNQNLCEVRVSAQWEAQDCISID